MDIDSILIYIKSKSSLAIVCVDIKKSNKINSGSTYEASSVETHNCTLVPVEPGLLTLLVNRWFLVSSYLSIFCFLCTIFSTIDRLFHFFFWPLYCHVCTSLIYLHTFLRDNKSKPPSGLFKVNRHILFNFDVDF